MTSLKDQVVLITGGGSGMGYASAKLFLEQGAKVAIAGRNETKLAEAAKSLGGGDKLMTHVADVSLPEQAKALVDAVVKKWSRIDILVNNAGLNLKKRAFRELTPESWQQVIRANLDGAFYCIHYAIGRCSSGRTASSSTSAARPACGRRRSAESRMPPASSACRRSV